MKTTDYKDRLETIHTYVKQVIRDTEGEIDSSSSRLLQMIKEESQTTVEEHTTEFQQSIQTGEVWEVNNKYLGLCYTDGVSYFNHQGQALRDPSEYNPHSEGYTPFGDE